MNVKEYKSHNISLNLNDYDEIFSDFDPRPYSERSLSVDFLDETRRASIDKGEGLELRLMVPSKKRKLKTERIITKRLRVHFERHNRQLQDKQAAMVKTGAGFVFIGIILMLAATFVLFKYPDGMLSHFLVVLFEPGGWFFFWEGLSQIIFETKKQKPEAEFYQKMARCSIEFSSH